MLCIKVKKIVSLSLVVFAISSVLFAACSYAADATATTTPLFGHLTQSGGRIFTGMRDIIYAVAGFGIIAIAIGAFFGNLNWKWLSAVIIGLVVIALTAGILSYMTKGYGVDTSSMAIQDSLKTGG